MFILMNRIPCVLELIMSNLEVGNDHLRYITLEFLDYATFACGEEFHSIISQPKFQEFLTSLILDHKFSTNMKPNVKINNSNRFL